MTTTRVRTLNLASGRDRQGVSLDAASLRAAVADLDGDVLSVQEIDTGQPRSHRVDQPAELAVALGAVDWRSAATLAGTPDPFASWDAVHPPVLRGPGDPGGAAAPHYGIALFSRRPVRRWHVHPLGTGRAKLPIQAPDPRSGQTRWWWFPDEPRVALAAELDGLTVVGTHLSFAPHTASTQLLRLRRWAATLPGPVVLAGDLNLVGSVPAALARGRRLVAGKSWPAADPRVQFDHVLALGRLRGSDAEVRQLSFGDHRTAAVTVAPS